LAEAQKRRVAVVVTARPSYSRVKTALQAIVDHPDLDLLLVVAASALLERYGEAVKVIEQDGFEVAAKVYNVLEGENLNTMARTTGLGIMELANVFGNLQPDCVVTIADRYETMATAVTASFMNIPLVHIQGGEVTGSIDEKVRHAITKLSDLHLVSTAKAKERVTRMGEDPERVFVTGCPSIDLAAEIMKSPDMDFDCYKKYGGVGPKPPLNGAYLVVMQHPVTTEYERAREDVIETLHAVHQLELPTLWFWPNVDAGSDGTSKGIRWFREEYNPPNIHYFKNMEPFDFLRLLYNSRGIIGNSSVAIRECSFLGVPAVNIGSRQNSRERGSNVIDVGSHRKQIEDAVLHHLQNGRLDGEALYGDGRAGERIATVIAEQRLSIEKALTY
jgi:UDP-hydrolysing UDP-N-acetyl-D-glucosamine 2-epimerase